MSFPDGKMDPPDPEVCPSCGALLDDLTDEEYADHFFGPADSGSEKAEIRADSEREERRG